MSFWKVAAAQYEPRKTSLTEQVAHHLEFVSRRRATMSAVSFSIAFFTGV